MCLPRCVWALTGWAGSNQSSGKCLSVNCYANLGKTMKKTKPQNKQTWNLLEHMLNCGRFKLLWLMGCPRHCWQSRVNDGCTLGWDYIWLIRSGVGVTVKPSPLGKPRRGSTPWSSLCWEKGSKGEMTVYATTVWTGCSWWRADVSLQEADFYIWDQSHPQ